MIGIVIIGHGRIASEMRDALEHVVGKQALVETLDVLNNDDLDGLTNKLHLLARACDVGHGVLFLADMFGGTPCNIAIGCLKAGHVELISGFNLPLLIKAATLRKSVKNLSAFTQQVMQAGRQYLHVSTDMIDGRPHTEAEEQTGK
jgi:PTS system mannose-specific IIA component